jgi:ribosomal protein L14E/L6E/L27E
VKPPIPIEPGRVVLSKAGRDAGRALVVLALDGPEYALAADGDLRATEKPKRKKKKHLAATPVCIPSIQEKLSTGIVPMNAEIRAALEQAGYGRTRPRAEEDCELGKER